MALKYNQSKSFEFSVKDLINIVWTFLVLVIWFYLENTELINNFLKEQWVPSWVIVLLTGFIWYIWKQYLTDNTK